MENRPKAAMVNATDGAVDGNTAALQLQVQSSVQPIHGRCGVWHPQPAPGTHRVRVQSPCSAAGVGGS